MCITSSYVSIVVPLRWLLGLSGKKCSKLIPTKYDHVFRVSPNLPMGEISWGFSRTRGARYRYSLEQVGLSAGCRI
jgi:hypothetical protein